MSSQRKGILYYSIQIMLMLSLITTFCLFQTIQSSTTPNQVIFYVSEPVSPGEYAMVAVASSFTNKTKTSPSLQIYGRQEANQPFAKLSTQGETEYGISVLIPSTYNIGEFELQARKGNVTGPVYKTNVPRPWFLFGNKGDHSTPGGTVRVIGDGIALPSTLSFPKFQLSNNQKYTSNTIPIPQLYLTPKNNADNTGNGNDLNPPFPPIQISSENITRSHASFRLPTNLPIGIYDVLISNSNSVGATKVPLCTFLTPETPCLSTLNVTDSQEWPTKKSSITHLSSNIITVKSTQPGYGRNATIAIQQALKQAQQKYSTTGEGSIIYFPRGQYFMQGPILLPEKCIIQGERKDLVSIYFFEDNKTTAPPAYITGENQNVTQFGIEDITIYVTSYANVIIQFQPATISGYVKHIRMRYNSYFALEPVTGEASRGRNTAWSHAQGTAIMLAGKNIQIENNDIYSTGDVVSTLYNGMAGGSYFHIHNNRFWNGGTTHWGIEWKQCIYENNVATGVSTTAMGSNYPQYNHNDGNPHVQNIYHYNNSQNMIWGNDREMMTSDAGGGVYWGAISVTDSHTGELTLKDWVGGIQPGGAMCILQGTATGECRRVVQSGTSASNYTQGWLPNKPFSVPLDATSRLAIMPYQGKIAFNSNHYSDGGSVQFYSTAMNCQAIENVFERTGGLIAWGRAGSFAPPHIMWGPNIRQVFYDNVIKEGNHVYNYNTNGDAQYHAGGSKNIEPWSFGSLSNDQGPPWEPPSKYNPGPTGFKGALNRFITMRGNIVESNGGIRVCGTSSNVLVEKNKIYLSDVGIHYNATTTMGGVVVENNVQPNDLPDNYNPYYGKDEL